MLLPAVFYLLLGAATAWPWQASVSSNTSLTPTGTESNATYQEGVVDTIVPRGLTFTSKKADPINKMNKNDYIYELVAAIYQVASQKGLDQVVPNRLVFWSSRGKSAKILVENVDGKTTFAYLGGGLYELLKWIQAGESVFETIFAFSMRGQLISRGSIIHREGPTVDDSATSISLNLTDADPTANRTTSTGFQSGVFNSSLFGTTPTNLTVQNPHRALFFDYHTIDRSVAFGPYPFMELCGKSSLALAYLYQDVPMVGASSLMSFTHRLRITFDASSALPISSMTPVEARDALFYLVTRAYVQHSYEYSEVVLRQAIAGRSFIVGKVVVEPFPLPGAAGEASTSVAAPEARYSSDTSTS